MLLEAGEGDSEHLLVLRVLEEARQLCDIAVRLPLLEQLSNLWLRGLVFPQQPHDFADLAESILGSDGLGERSRLDSFPQDLLLHYEWRVGFGGCWLFQNLVDIELVVPQLLHLQDKELGHLVPGLGHHFGLVIPPEP